MISGKALVEPHIYMPGGMCMDHSTFIAPDAGKRRQLSNADPEPGYQHMQAAEKVMASRLSHTRIILVGEESLSLMSNY
ncbi:MAG: hypothetical protein V1766_07955 [Pseudomonadota bacterium]